VFFASVRDAPCFVPFAPCADATCGEYVFFFAEGEDMSLQIRPADEKEVKEAAGKGDICWFHPIPGYRAANTACFAEIGVPRLRI